tara:strand:+ start:287 stop:499 length:213 start_codon:yes stop_codon:yes gene_type:complete
MKVGDLLNYYDVDGGKVPGVIVKGPHYSEVTESQAVKVAWFDDGLITDEPISIILSNELEYGYIELVSEA